MSITLTYLSVPVALPADLFWADEHDWQPVEQTVDRSVTGALIVSVAARQAGRPITLRPLADDCAWITRATLHALLAWAAVPGAQMVLTLRGAARNVIWRHQDTAIEATPVRHLSDALDADWYRATFRLQEI